MSPPLDQLRDLKAEPPDPLEIQRLIAVAETWLADCTQANLSTETRFVLAYGAAHAICVAALRRLGYRTGKRYLVFQLMPMTLGLGAEVWRVLDKAHERRNLLEYEGMTDIEPQLPQDTISAAHVALVTWKQLTAAD